MWKSGNLEIWKSGNMRGTQGLIVNVLTLKSGNVEICVERFNS